MHRRDFIHMALASLLPVGLSARAVRAAPQAYVLGPQGARVTYIFVLSGTEQRGTVPVTASRITVDPSDLTASRVAVSADVRQAKTGLLFATQALKSPSMLDANAHPTARFVTTRVTTGPGGRLSDGAAIEGNLTLRGVTRPIRFDASVFRPQGSAADNLSRLTIRMRGTLSRTDFGVSGYADLVADEVRMNIDAEIRVAG